MVYHMSNRLDQAAQQLIENVQRAEKDLPSGKRRIRNNTSGYFRYSRRAWDLHRVIPSLA